MTSSHSPPARTTPVTAGGHAVAVAGELEAREPERARRMSGGGSPGDRRSLSPPDEEGERGLGRGLVDSGQPPAQRAAIAAGARAAAHGEAEPLRNLVEPIRAGHPAERLPGAGLKPVSDPAPERARRRLGFVDDRDQLEVRLAKRHDPVGGAPAGVTATLQRGEPMARLQLAPRRLEVRDRDDHMVELQAASLAV